MPDVHSVIVQKDDSGMSIESREVYAHCTIERIPVIARDGESIIRGELDAELDAGTLVVGSVEVVSDVLQALGVEIPVPDYYPDVLAHALHRHVEKTSAADALARLERGEEFFVKSAGWKLMAGQLADGDSTRDQLQALGAEAEVWVSEPVRFVSEYRAYVNQGEVLGVGCYSTEDSATPDLRVIWEAARLLADTPGTPLAYAFDWGVLEDGTTALVEMNDGWAIGLYDGVTRRQYFELLEARWCQLAMAAHKPAIKPRQ